MQQKINLVIKRVNQIDCYNSITKQLKIYLNIC